MKYGANSFILIPAVKLLRKVGEPNVITPIEFSFKYIKELLYFLFNDLDVPKFII